MMIPDAKAGATPIRRADGRSAAMPMAPPPAAADAAMPRLRLGDWDGPLDRLLEQARAHRVDLARLPAEALATQCAAQVVAALADRSVPLPRLAEWVILAAQLLALQAGRLVPDPPAKAQPSPDAAALARRLADRAAIRRLADWLEGRPQLGRAVFGRGFAEPATQAEPAADLTGLLRACLTLLELPAYDRVYRPPLPPLWRVPEALAHLRHWLHGRPAGPLPLAGLLPELRADATGLQHRAAFAALLMASLELTRDGAVTLEQSSGFGEIRLRPASAGPDRQATAGG